MAVCAVTGCNNHWRKTRGTNIKYFRFPQNDDLQKMWIEVCRKDNVNPKTGRICSSHFKEEEFVKPLCQQLLNYSPKSCRKLRNDSVPTLNLCNEMQNTEKSARQNERVNQNLVLEYIPTVTHPNAEEVPQIGGSEDQQLLQPISEDITNQLKARIHLLEAEKKLATEQRDELLICKKSWDKEKVKLQQEMKILKKIKNRDLESALTHMLQPMFTPGQIKVLLSKERKRIIWSSEDYAAAISLRCVSPKAYRYLRSKLRYPLPALSTLSKWALKTLNLNEGLLQDILYLMKAKGKSLTKMERVTVICYDEMHLSELICFDTKKQCIVGPSKTVQVIMARGLTGKWKQPVFYKYNQSMTVAIIKNVVCHLENCGYPVVAMTSDLGGGNRKIWSELHISPLESSSFQNPHDQHRNIYVFADIPHLLKLHRNHFLDSGFRLGKQQVVGKKCVEDLIKISSNDLKIAHKLSVQHLDVRGMKRQKVKFAVQLFSNTTSRALAWCGQNQLIKGDWNTAAKIFKLTNDWFDMFNATQKFGHHTGLNAYGVDIEEQNPVLDEMSKLINEIRIGLNKKRIFYQNAILVNNKSLQELLQEVKNNFNIQYILTYKLNQDVLENFFGYIRGMGHSNDHPSALEFKNRLRLYILGKHADAVFTANRNSIEQNTDICLVQPSQSLTLNDTRLSSTNQNLSLLQKELCSTVDLFNAIFPSNFEFSVSDEKEGLEDAKNYNVYVPAKSSSTIIEREGMKYIAGYVAHRFRMQWPHLGIETHLVDPADENVNDWILFISKGHLTYPSKEMILVAEIAEQCFIDLHGKFIAQGEYIVDRVVNDVMCKVPDGIVMPQEAITCLVRTRTYIRIKELNKKIAFAGSSGSARQLNKKMRKFTRRM